MASPSVSKYNAFSILRTTGELRGNLDILLLLFDELELKDRNDSIEEKVCPEENELRDEYSQCSAVYPAEDELILITS